MIGLTQKEATIRLQEFGFNQLHETKSGGALQLFFSQFTNILTLLLGAASLLSVYSKDFLDAVLIFSILLLNATLGFIQEYKAEKAIAALRNISQPLCRVRRDGKEQRLPSRLLVPGDVIILEAGDLIPADALLLEASHVQINEASLTGESSPVEKHVSTQYKTYIYTGTIMSEGKAEAQVTTTGDHTKLGGIATKLGTLTKEKTPLEKRVLRLGKQLGLLALGASLVIFFAGIVEKLPLKDIVLTSMSVAVAAVPEGLPTVITIALAMGTQRMVKRKTIIRKLAAIETLGSITIIATDKTGTLTKNEMTVTHVWLDNKLFETATFPSFPASPITELFLDICVFCTTATLEDTMSPHSVLGDSTEGALLWFAQNHHRDIGDERQKIEILETFFFDPKKKIMSVIIQKPKAKAQLLSKGSPEKILELCTQIATTDGVEELTSSKRKLLQEELTILAGKGLRLVAFAYREAVPSFIKREHAEQQLTFLGFIGITDPPRLEVAGAIRDARRAGIRTVMITGDNEHTAFAIGKELGLVTTMDEVMGAATYASLSPSEVTSSIEHTQIFARTTPEQKYEIVQRFQDLGHIVAVTGDGVNDALALKKSNVGIAMGITGTDVAKEAADIVITDDNYATIIAAVEEGRAIFDNMKTSIKYLIGSNIGEIASIVLSVLLGWPLILTPLQILYVNLITDGLPALGLALTPAQAGLMKQKPRPSSQLFTKADVRWYIEIGILTPILTLTAFGFGYASGNIELARTFAFCILIFAQQGIYLDLLTRNSSILRPQPSLILWYVIPVLPVVLQILLLEVTLFRSLFHLARLDSSSAIISVILLSLVVPIVSECRKKLIRTP